MNLERIGHAAEYCLRWILQSILSTPVMFWSCILADLIGTVFGLVFWYGPMLMDAPLWAIPFIPDCPLAALLGSVVLLILRAKKRWPLMETFAAFACMKYGAWTIGFWLRHWASPAPVEPIGLLMFTTHTGLFCEGLLLLPGVRDLTRKARAGVWSWFILSVMVDYRFGYHPPLASVPLSYAFGMALTLTMLIGGMIMGYPRPRCVPSEALWG